MKVARASQKEIDAMFEFFNMLDEKLDDPRPLFGGNYLDDRGKMELAESVIKAWRDDEVWCSWRWVFFNLVTLMDSCTDPGADTLEFRPDIADALQGYAPGTF
jgi:hypothetical protein